MDELKVFFQQDIDEVICVVEGIDPLTSGSFQSLQSYKYEDIVWEKDAQLTSCLKVSNGKIMVDLDRFHDHVCVDSGGHFPSIRAHDSFFVSSHDIPSL